MLSTLDSQAHFQSLVPSPVPVFVEFACNLYICQHFHNCSYCHRAVIFANSQAGPTSALIKAEVPWSVRRASLSEKEKVLKSVKG
jgi:hypothetical protein